MSVLQNPFDAATPEMKTAVLTQANINIRARVTSMARQMVVGYRELMKLTYEGRDEASGVTYTSGELIANWTMEEIVAFRMLAIRVKTLINSISPGTIVDPVPEGEFVMPANIFPDA